MIPDLVYDVGMNNGDDTAYYLAEGYRVVAVEANPRLAAQARERFARELREEQLVILDLGVADHHGTLPFYVNDENDEWSSFLPELGWRKGTRGHRLDVEVVPLAEVLRAHGVPWYLKIDVERSDRHCLQALGELEEADRPEYVSVEVHDLDYAYVLHGLGYPSFKLVDQRGHNWPESRVRRQFEPGASGPVGEDTTGEWISVDQVAYEYLHFRLGHPERMESGWSARVEPAHDWFDFHARRW